MWTNCLFQRLIVKRFRDPSIKLSAKFPAFLLHVIMFSFQWWIGIEKLDWNSMIHVYDSPFQYKLGLILNRRCKLAHRNDTGYCFALCFIRPLVQLFKIVQFV